MADPRIEKLASVLVHYSLEIKPEQQLRIHSSPLAEELTVAVFTESIKAGAHIDIVNEPSAITEIFYRHASESQLQHISPMTMLAAETFDAILFIEAKQNTRALTSIDPSRLSTFSRTMEAFWKVILKRAERGDFRWCYTLFPNHAAAQEAEMSLSEYEDFVFAAMKLDKQDPVADWKEESTRLHDLKGFLEGKDEILFKGKDIDLSLSIQGRTFEVGDGQINFPDGEIWTAPIEDSVEGWVRYSYPAIEGGREVDGIELWFEGGKVVKHRATKGEEFLASMLDTDAGSRILGEWGIGTNYDIGKFTKHMLFDEKLGGTIHFALGSSYPETGGKNESGVHWDMLCDMSEAEIRADGEAFYRNGMPLMWT